MESQLTTVSFFRLTRPARRDSPGVSGGEVGREAGVDGETATETSDMTAPHITCMYEEEYAVCERTAENDTQADSEPENLSRHIAPFDGRDPADDTERALLSPAETKIRSSNAKRANERG